MGVPKRKSPAATLTVVGLVIALVITGTIIGVFALNKTLYGPGAFVQSYLSLLAKGRAADALALPGVQPEGDTELDPTASAVLLRQDALGKLTNIKVVSEKASGKFTLVTVKYKADGQPGQSVFKVESNGWSGLAPAWKFAETPLAMLNLEVAGSMDMQVNGFHFDKRQVSAAGLETEPDAPVSLLVFTPGSYAVSVDNKLSATDGATILVDEPLQVFSTEVTAAPTDEFLATVQAEVDQFLQGCVDQGVLLPAGCPFGLEVQGRIEGSPSWSISTAPEVELLPDGANWTIPEIHGVATIDVTMLSLFDGSTTERVEKIPFTMSGSVMILGDGSASIHLEADTF